MAKMWSYSGTQIQNDWHSYLKHYASEYYDPVKAHQYYEEHKKLKGRTSTAGLSSSQKITASYVKKSIQDEYKNNVESSKEEQKVKQEDLKNTAQNDITTYRDQAQIKINSLVSELKNMRPIDRKSNRLRIQRQIDILRADNTAKRKEILEKYKDDSGTLSTEYKNSRSQMKTDADNKYANELDKIRSESSYGSSGSSSDHSSGSSSSARYALDRDEIRRLAKQASTSLETKKKNK